MFLFAAVAAMIAAAPTEPALRFGLGPESVPGHVHAPAGTTYDAARGYGWEDAHRFSVRVPEGNYRVTVTLGRGAASPLTIKAEARRLMVEAVATRRGRTVTRSFVVNVRTPALDALPDNAPGGSAVRLNPREIGSASWDDRLTLEFLGAAASVRAVSVERADVPTLFLAGDSTVADQPAEPAASWGQMLPRFFAPGIAIANHAESGETLKSFSTSLRLDKLLSQVRPGDWLMIQFGHNDQKRQWPQTYAEAETTFRAWLRVYITEARRRGARPILVTSPERRNFDAAGRIVPSHGAYPDAVRAVAREEGVPLIDLHAMSIAFYEALGPERAALAFSDGGRDRTHHNNFGAHQLARMIVEGLRTVAPELAVHLSDEAGRYDPARPDPPETFRLPASGARSGVSPRGD